MGSDMIVALKEASANGTSLFGLNHYTDSVPHQAVHLVPGHMHDPDEVSHTSTLALPQARQTFTVLGVQSADRWGFTHGVNEHRVAIGITDWKSRLPAGARAVTGPELVRLALERSRGAHHAVEVLTDLLERQGQGSDESMVQGASDHIFLIADASEAFILETAGRYWALLECGPTRAVTDVAMIRQDWRRLAPGLADCVIEQGWAQDDGSKIDFVRCLGENAEQTKNAQKRWGRASLALAQQQGAIDLHYLRRMLAEHYFENRDILPVANTTMMSSFLTDLHKTDQPTLAWVAFGSPKVGLYFPLCLVGDLPTAFGDTTATSIQQRVQDLQKMAQTRDRAKLPAVLERLQTKFDQDAEDLVTRAHDYALHGKPYLVAQVATEMMHNHVELFEAEYRRLFGLEERTPHMVPKVEEEVLFFA